MNHHRWRFPKSGDFGEWSVGLLKGKEERGGVEVQGRRSQQGLAAECQACPEALVSLRTRLYLTALGQARFSLLISDQRKHKGKGAGGGAPPCCSPVPSIRYWLPFPFPTLCRTSGNLPEGRATFEGLLCLWEEGGLISVSHCNCHFLGRSQALLISDSFFV